jgi:hypothetical protein
MTKSTDIKEPTYVEEGYESPYSIPEHEPKPNKSLTFKNKSTFVIRIGQIASDWNRVNFIIENGKYKQTQKQKELAILDPGDTIEIQFLKPELIEP